jgi:hypothetical protein
MRPVPAIGEVQVGHCDRGQYQAPQQQEGGGARLVGRLEEAGRGAQPGHIIRYADLMYPLHQGEKGGRASCSAYHTGKGST